MLKNQTIDIIITQFSEVTEAGWCSDTKQEPEVLSLMIGQFVSSSAMRE